MPSIRTILNPYDAVYLIAAALLVALYTLTAGDGFPLDDSWIHQVYGRNLAQFGEWSFIPGEPSAASTAPLYTVLLAAGYVIAAPYQLWTHLLGVLALAGAGMLAARLAARLAAHDRFTPFLTGLGVIFSWHMIWAAASGMETMLFGAFTLLLIWLAWRELDTRSTETHHVALRGALFGLCTALTVLVRPEGALLAGFVALILLLTRPAGSLRLTIIWGMGAAAGFGLAVAPYLVLNLSLTGGPLPATADAKQAQHAPLLAISYHQRVFSMMVPVLVGGQFLLLPGVVFIAGRELMRLRDDPRRLLILLPLLWAVGLVLLYAARLPAAYQHGRYVMPALPALIVLGIPGTVALVFAARRSLMGRVFSRTLAASAALVFVYFGLILGPDVFARDVRIINEEMVAPARWIAENIPPDDLLAVHDIGAVGYFAPRPIIDIAGLLNPEVVPVLYEPEALWALVQDGGAVYMMGFPDQLPGRTDDDARLCPRFQSDGTASLEAGDRKMTVFALAWDGDCAALPDAP